MSSQYNGNGVCVTRMTCAVIKGLVGSGSGVAIKHFMPVAPDFVIPILHDTIGAANQYTIGAITDTTVTITATSMAVFDLWCLAKE